MQKRFYSTKEIFLILSKHNYSYFRACLIRSLMNSWGILSVLIDEVSSTFLNFQWERLSNTFRKLHSLNNFHKQYLLIVNMRCFCIFKTTCKFVKVKTCSQYPQYRLKRGFFSFLCESTIYHYESAYQYCFINILEYKFQEKNIAKNFK